MKAGILFQRDGIAQQRILAAAAGLAERLGMPPRLMENLQVQRGDPATRAMQEREAVADLLEAVVERVEAIQGESLPPAVEVDWDAVLEKISQAGLNRAAMVKIREALVGSSE